MSDQLEVYFQANKGRMVVLLNFMLFPYVLGHFDNRDYACEFSIVKRNCTAFRGLGENRWNIHNPETTFDNQITVVSHHSNDWRFLNLKTFKEIFEKEQFNHPFRAAIVEKFCRF